MYANINEQLRVHFSSGDGAAEYLRKKAPGFIQGLDQFMKARSDVRRLQEAEKLAAVILKLYDFRDIQLLRRNVATLELKRLIQYQRQSDHTAHTVYLFLLGIWIFDRNEIVKNAFMNQLSNTEKYIQKFIFQWMFASLLHDIGYLFYELNDHNLQFYDSMFSAQWIENNTFLSNGSVKKDILDIWNEFLRSYKPWVLQGSTKAVEVVNKICKVPWLKELIPDAQGDAIAILRSLQDSNDSLRKFAYATAEKGYNGQGEPRVDHAIAGGLMLLQYTSIWYWLYGRVQTTLPTVSSQIFGDYRYPENMLHDSIVPACRAVAYHNIPNELLYKIDINKEPLLFLAILCDEIQTWDRFPAGDTVLENWEKEVQVMAEDIIANTVLDKDGNLKICLRFLDLKCGNDIIRKLSNRLTDWENVIQIGL